MNKKVTTLVLGLTLGLFPNLVLAGIGTDAARGGALVGHHRKQKAKKRELEAQKQAAGAADARSNPPANSAPANSAYR